MVMRPATVSVPAMVELAPFTSSGPETYNEVVVAFVLVAFTVTKFVMVEVLLFTRSAAPAIVCCAVQVFA